MFGRLLAAKNRYLGIQSARDANTVYRPANTRSAIETDHVETTTYFDSHDTLKEALQQYSVDARASSFEYSLTKLEDQLKTADIARLADDALKNGQPKIYNILAAKYPAIVNAQTMADHYRQASSSSEVIFEFLSLHRTGNLASSLISAFRGSNASSPAIRIQDGDANIATPPESPIVVSHTGGKYDGEVQVTRSLSMR